MEEISVEIFERCPEKLLEESMKKTFRVEASPERTQDKSSGATIERTPEGIPEEDFWREFRMRNFPKETLKKIEGEKNQKERILDRTL